MEADETKLRKAAHLMVQSLAASLVLVGYRDPLRARQAHSPLSPRACVP
jgi:hypothetical protein